MIAVAPLLFGGRAWTAPPAARRGVTLADGSRVLLDGGSTLETRWLWGARHVRLARGEALFEVAHDPRRPFYVDAGPTIIVARGTRFDVLRLSQTTRVVLLRGVVDVWDQQSLSRIHRLAPDQSIATGAHKPSPIDPQRVLDWTRGRIRFDHAPVGEAVELMERHSDTPLRLTPAAQASPLRLSGEFSEGDVAGFVDALRALTGWSARKDADGVLALGPDETSQTSS